MSAFSDPYEDVLEDEEKPRTMPSGECLAIVQ
jgi:hypothetical protein